MLRAVTVTVAHAMRIATMLPCPALHWYDTALRACAGAEGSANHCQGQCCMAPKTCSGNGYGDYTCA